MADKVNLKDVVPGVAAQDVNPTQEETPILPSAKKTTPKVNPFVHGCY